MINCCPVFSSDSERLRLHLGARKDSSPFVVAAASKASLLKYFTVS
jgi:hypothetical protein